ncbi:unnamed protein product [Wuchereria bancrofti]|uniref:Uncharacterized protein n=1 Tax=Wuchereria bancrofti TaxID=6293 RepID=A0A3P7E589_WUCBA|nr:unnamed protein product [Wuchereria bancrofti]
MKIWWAIVLLNPLILNFVKDGICMGPKIALLTRFRLIVSGWDDQNIFVRRQFAVFAKSEGPVVPHFCVRPEPVELDYKFKLGSTNVLKQKEIKYDIVESMDISH